MRAYALFCFASTALLSGAMATQALGQAMPDLSHQPPEIPATPLEVFPANSPYVIYPARGGVYMISGPASNTLVQVGKDGVLLVDPGPAEGATALLEQVRRLSRKPIMEIMNTNGDADHVGANGAIAASGVLLEGTANTRPKVVAGSGGAPILAHEDVLKRLTEQGMTEGLPSQSYFVAQKDLFYNGEPISLLHAPGHTSGDSFVMLRRSDVIAAGDIYNPDSYPQIDLAHGGSIQGVLDSLNHLIRLTIPEFNEEGGTFVIPGHGRLSDEGDVADYRDMVTFIRDRVQAMIARRMTLAQIKAARPTFDYDPRYGKEAGDAFVEQIYRSLTASPKAGGKTSKGAQS